MLKTMAFAALLGAMTTLIPAGAGAMPLAQDKAGIATGDTVLLVREGCGRGMQWSDRYRMCVPDSARAQRHDAVKRDRRDGCGMGWHWSERYRRCVRS